VARTLRFVRVLCRGWLASRARSSRSRCVRHAALRCGPPAPVVGSRLRPSCLGAVAVDVMRGLLVPPAVLPPSLSLRARWCGPSGVSARRVRADPAPPLGGRWLRKHAMLLPHLLARTTVTPLRSGWDRSAGAFASPLCSPCPPSRRGCCWQTGWERPPLPNQPRPRVRHRVTSPRDRRLLPVWPHRAPIGDFPLRRAFMAAPDRDQRGGSSR
jgi:hypothetical protein